MNTQKFFEELMKKYLEDEEVNILSFLSEKNIETLSKLGITIEDKLYTEDEFEMVEEEIYLYYSDPNDPDLPEIKSLKEKNVSDEEYKDLIEVFLTISREYE